MNWLLMRWLRRTLDRDGQDWNTMLILQGIAMLLFFLLMGVGVLAEAEEQVSPEWQPNQELLRKLEEMK